MGAREHGAGTRGPLRGRSHSHREQHVTLIGRVQKQSNYVQVVRYNFIQNSVYLGQKHRPSHQVHSVKFTVSNTHRTHIKTLPQSKADNVLKSLTLYHEISSIHPCPMAYHLSITHPTEIPMSFQVGVLNIPTLNCLHSESMFTSFQCETKSIVFRVTRSHVQTLGPCPMKSKIQQISRKPPQSQIPCSQERSATNIQQLRLWQTPKAMSQRLLMRQVLIIIQFQ